MTLSVTAEDESQGSSTMLGRGMTEPGRAKNRHMGGHSPWSSRGGVGGVRVPRSCPAAKGGRLAALRLTGGGVQDDPEGGIIWGQP